MRLKRYKKRGLGHYISYQLIIIIVSLISAVLIIEYFHKGINKVMMPLAEIETRKYMTEIINDSTKDIKFDKDLFVIERDNNEIKMITYNSYEATKLINGVTNNIQNRLKKDDEFIITKIPLGIIFKNVLLKNFGPIIKVKMNIVGNVLSELETEVKPYGINNALVEVRVKLSANAMVVLPFSSKEINIQNVIPISINIVNGSIPEAYIAGFK